MPRIVTGAMFAREYVGEIDGSKIRTWQEHTGAIVVTIPSDWNGPGIRVLVATDVHSSHAAARLDLQSLLTELGFTLLPN